MSSPLFRFAVMPCNKCCLCPCPDKETWTLTIAPQTTDGCSNCCQAVAGPTFVQTNFVLDRVAPCTWSGGMSWVLSVTCTSQLSFSLQWISGRFVLIVTLVFCYSNSPGFFCRLQYQLRSAPGAGCADVVQFESAVGSTTDAGHGGCTGQCFWNFSTGASGVYLTP